MTSWKQVEGFPTYSVSTSGDVRNDRTGRLLHCTQNQSGVLHVGLMRAQKQYRRSVALLVANAFLTDSGLGEGRAALFDTPINLDGDRTNNNVRNLMWRPRWFAVKYNRQFHKRYRFPIVTPVKDVKSGEISEDSFAAAVRYGLLEEDVVLSIANHTLTWPTYQEFEIVPDVF